MLLHHWFLRSSNFIAVRKMRMVRTELMIVITYFSRKRRYLVSEIAHRGQACSAETQWVQCLPPERGGKQLLQISLSSSVYRERRELITGSKGIQTQATFHLQKAIVVPRNKVLRGTSVSLLGLPLYQDLVPMEHFINEWRMSIQNTTLNPILRTYNVLKTRFGTEPYLRSVKDIKYRVAISKLRVSSHALEIERGRYTSPMTPVNERLCHACQQVEDEFHIMMECKSNSNLRQTFINRLTTRWPNFADLSQREQFVYMFTNEDDVSLTWLGKFIYKSFQRRNSVGSNLWNIYWYDYSLCIYIYI